MKAIPTLLFSVLVLGACAGGSAREPASPAPTPAATPAARPDDVAGPTHVDAATMAAAARADSLRDSWNQADADFMTHMIHHHAQALVMAQMVPTHTETSSLQVLAGRIINAQNDEIALMQTWLRERGLPVPDPAHMNHGPHGQHMAMAGMLTPEQIQRLDAARGAEFDRLFLQGMIQHHSGAIEMVNELFSQHGAAQGDAIFKIASDINVDQETEIDRMRLMLRDLVIETEVP